VLTRVPEEARAHVRAWRLPAGARARLAGPVHSGHGVETPAVHSELFVGGTALTLARWPNIDEHGGFAAIGSLVDPGSAPRNGWDDVPLERRVTEPARGGVFVPADGARPARWAGEPDAWALGFWNWDWSHEQLPIAKVDATSGAVTLAMPHTYGLAQRGKFFVRNVLSELDSEGEYWIDRGEGIVYAWLPAGAAESECAVSLLGEPMLVLDRVRGAEIRGISFECTRGAVISARSCEGVRIESCAFANTGTRAVALDGHANTLARCAFRDIGGTGVLLTGGDRPTLARGDSAVEDCTFRECGRVLRSYSPAVVVEGVGNRVSHCAITRHPHIALWFRGNDHLVEANEFSEVVYETGDAGAVYVGRDWTAQGTVIRGNLFHDIRGSDARFQNAVYLDDMSSGITVEDNVFVRCNWGVLVGGGRDNTLRRNTFVSCAKAVSWDARGVGWMAKEIEDPSTSTLLRTYAAMPVSSDVWKSRYPNLGDYLTFDFGRPVRGVLAESRLIGTPIGRIDDRERVRETGTTSEAVEGAILAERCVEWIGKTRIRTGPRGSATR
jgi:parallel beta-helix repeat protein